MSDAIRKTTAAAPAAKPVAAPVAPAAETVAAVKPSWASDRFDFDKKPTAADLEGFRAAIKALDAVGRPPMGLEGKAAWLAKAKPALEAAEKGLNGLDDARFWHKIVGEDECTAAREKVSALRDRVQDAEEATGVRQPTEPASPIRPLFQLTDGAKGLISSHPLLAIVGIVLLPVAVVVDCLDAVTRPLQALAYPFFKARHEIRENRYEKLHPGEAK